MESGWFLSCFEKRQGLIFICIVTEIESAIPFYLRATGGRTTLAEMGLSAFGE